MQVVHIVFTILTVAVIICLFFILFPNIETFEETSEGEMLMRLVDPSFGSGGMLIPIVRTGGASYVPAATAAPATPAPVAPVTTIAPVASDLDAQIVQFKLAWPAADFQTVATDLMSTKKCQKTTADIASTPTIKTNKAQLVKVMTAKGMSKQLQIFMLAYAMIETGELTVKDRDSSKDNQKGAENYSLFNINKSMIKDTLAQDAALAAKIGALDPVPQCKLNDDTEAGISLTLDVVLAGIKLWGLDRYTSYLRGGGTLFNDTKDYRKDSQGGFLVRVFKCGFSLLVDMISKDEKYLTDDRRIGLCIPYV